jgi:hypothetical protein
MNKISFIILISILSLNVYSQGTILRDDISDGQRIIEAYFNPLAESLGAGLNNGWYNTAKPHNFAGFDFTISLSTVIIPNEVKTFSIGNNFGNFTSNNTDAATIFGKNSTTSMMKLPLIINGTLIFQVALIFQLCQLQCYRPGLD